MTRFSIKPGGGAFVSTGKGRGCWQTVDAIEWTPCAQARWSADTMRYVDTGEAYLSVKIEPNDAHDASSYYCTLEENLEIAPADHDLLIGRIGPYQISPWAAADQDEFRRGRFAKTQATG